MTMSSLTKYAAVAAVAGALLAPAATFANPFIFGGPGYQAPVHTAAPAAGERAFAYAPRAANEAAAPVQYGMSRTNRACTVRPSSISYEPCMNH